MTRSVHIVGFGGTLRAGSSTERAVATVLSHAADFGAQTRLISGPDLALPLYNAADQTRSPQALDLIDALRKADGVVIGSPGYHGSVSGLVKNAIDYIEDMSTDPRPYLDRRAVGLIASGAGMAGAMTTLSALRDISHALRGYTTPFGYAFNSTDQSEVAREKSAEQTRLLARQVVELASGLYGKA